jgi:CheY-like chemotaxis protein/two-component sensor histidine kinase
VLTVSDTGVGIVAEELPQLFQRFHRVAGATARTREGTGIGLALVHELAALHGGSVSVASEAGAGSTFTVTLPFGTPDADAAPGPAFEPSDAARGEAASWERDTARPGRTHSGTGSSPAARVLVVDDNADMRAYLTRLLSPHWSVQTTANGEEALRAVSENPPSVVLTDVMMPRIDGFQLLQALRSNPATAGIPVIMLTARAGQEAAVEGLEAGADDYLAKPFQAPELLARMRVALERAAGRRSTTTPPSQAPFPVTEPITLADVLRLTGDAASGDDTVSDRAPGAGAPTPRRPTEDRVGTTGGDGVKWRFRSDPASIPVLRRRLRAFLGGAGVDDDRSYDLLLAACEAATNAIEHAQEPTRPHIDVSAEVVDGRVRIAVRDYGQWRERGPSMDRGRGSALMSAIGEITATPSADGTTVVIACPVVDERSNAASG